MARVGEEIETEQRFRTCFDADAGQKEPQTGLDSQAEPLNWLRPLFNFAVAAFADRELANAVARHKAMFFAEKAADRSPIDYASAGNGGLQLVPAGDGAKALADDHARMVDDGLLLDEAEPFETPTECCADVTSRANAAPTATEMRPICDSRSSPASCPHCPEMLGYTHTDPRKPPF